MNQLVTEANELLRNGGFEYAFCGGQALDLFLGYESRVHGDIDVCVYWDERNRIIRYMQSQGFEVFEMLGGGRAHRITDVSDQIQKKKNIFCFRNGCPLVKTYPPDGDGCCWMEFFHIGQTELDFIEFLFNDQSQGAFEYARNRMIALEMEKAVLFRDGVPYLAPELCLLYKSTDIEREGYQQDFELVCRAMDPARREWLRNAFRQEYPGGHPWLDVLQAEERVPACDGEGEYVCRIATEEEMNRKWDYEIGLHADQTNWKAWKEEAIESARAGKSIPYYGILDGTVICEATANLDPDFRHADREKTTERAVELCAFRTNQEYRGKGYFSKLMDFMQNDLMQRGYSQAVVGVEPDEKRNREIYHHWGFTEYIGSATETYPDGTVIDVVFFGKQLRNPAATRQRPGKNENAGEGRETLNR